MQSMVNIDGRPVGDDYPVYIVAEIGINHNGDVALARQLIAAAADAGCDAVKFQKRVPEISVPAHYRDVMRETPWGYITYLEYKERVELSEANYDAIDDYCDDIGIPWFASCWDVPSVDMIERYAVPAYKVASASLTDTALLERMTETGKPIILSTGMSTVDEIAGAVDILGEHPHIVCHSTSTYPCRPDELNLRLVERYCSIFDSPVGYSGHEDGILPSIAAVALGARVIERHITLDNTMWGTDQAASLEPGEFARLIAGIRMIECALGDGVKRVYPSEIPVRDKLRRVGI